MEEAWPVILQAAALDAVPMNSDGKGYSRTAAENNIWISMSIGIFLSLSYFSDRKQMITLGSAKVKFGTASLSYFEGAVLILHQLQSRATNRSYTC